LHSGLGHTDDAQIGAAIVPTGFGFTPAGSISVSVIVVSAMLSLVFRSAQVMALPPAPHRYQRSGSQQ